MRVPRKTVFKIARLSLLLALVGVVGLSACTPASSTSPVYPPPEDATQAEPQPEGTFAQAYPSPLPLGGVTAQAYPSPESGELVAADTAAPAAAGSSCLADMVVEAVALPAADGVQIMGDLYLPAAGGERVPGVILLHMLGSNRRSWLDFPQTLVGACYAVLAIDLRGHGETSGQNDWVKARQDLQQEVDYLANRPEVRAEKIAIIGASIGSNLALNAGADKEAVRTVVLLSPGLDYAGVTTEDALERFGARPILIFASEEDTYAADSARVLDEAALGDHLLVMYQGAGHGTNMFAREPGLSQQIIDWLAAHLD